WVRTTHEIATDVMLGLIVIHVAANIIMSVVHRENLIVAMWNGWKRPP
ncbi:MAG: cytochrome B, partial [Alphaproteobacteria bacterium]|nr:cytochrome B [Alphaproteobacteria bacterium]